MDKGKYYLEWLLGAWFIAGLISLHLGVWGKLSLGSAWLLLPVVFILGKILWLGNRRLVNLSRPEVLLAVGIFIIWLSHLLQVFVPETAFDAVWYHLPAVKIFIQNRGLVYDEVVFQTANPIFSDLIFLLGFEVLGSFGTKIIAYLLALTLVVVVYHLARQFVNRFWSLLVVAGVSLFQVVAWQSASFYVDVAVCLWQVGSLYFLLKTTTTKTEKSIWFYLLSSSLLLGAAVGSKIIGVATWAILAVLLGYLHWGNKSLALKMIIFNLLVTLIALPSYFLMFNHRDSYFSQMKPTGIQQYASVGDFLWRRGVSLPLAGAAMFLDREYLSPLLLLLPLAAWVCWRRRGQLGRAQIALWLFFGGQLAVYWLAIPASSRYALSGFVVVMLIVAQALAWQVKQLNKTKRSWLIALAVGLVFLGLGPRLIVNGRSLNLLFGLRGEKAIIERLTIPANQEVLQKWYQHNQFIEFLPGAKN